MVDFWKKGPKYRWGHAHRPHSIVVFPDDFVRLHERVAWEFSHNSDITHVSVLVKVPRHEVDAVTAGKNFPSRWTPTFLEGWGEGLAFVSAVCLVAPVKLQHFPAPEVAIHPTGRKAACGDIDGHCHHHRPGCCGTIFASFPPCGHLCHSECAEGKGA